MANNKQGTVEDAYGDATDAEWDVIRERFGPDFVYFRDFFRNLVSELRWGMLDERLGVTVH